MPQDTLQFFDWLRKRLTQRIEKKYAEIGPVAPLDLAFFKHGALNLPYVIAVADASHISNTPSEIFQQVEGWFKKLLGTTGKGCLLFVYQTAPAVTTIEEIQKIDSFVTAGAHDLHTGQIGYVMISILSKRFMEVTNTSLLLGGTWKTQAFGLNSLGVLFQKPAFSCCV
jgi:hypothetical protein